MARRTKEEMIIQMVIDSRDAEVKLNQFYDKIVDFQKASSKFSDKPIISDKEFKKALKQRELDSKKRQQAQKRRLADQKREAKEEHKNMLYLQRGFLQASLSIMFFGQKVNQFFKGIRENSMSTFLALTADTEAANNATNRLRAGMEGLSYTMGEAINDTLEPYENAITNIKDRIEEFIQKNPELAGTFTLLGEGIGKVLEIGGQIGTFVIGLVAGVYALKMVGITSLATFGTVAGGIVLVIAKLLAVVAVFYIIFGLLRNDKTVVNWVSKGIVFIAKFLATLMWFSDSVAQSIIPAFTLAWKFGINQVISFFEKLVNSWVDSINWLIRAYNKVASLLGLREIGQLGKVDFSKWKLDLSKEQDALKDIWSKDRFNEYMLAAEDVGAMFKDGISTLTTLLGTNSQKEKETTEKNEENVEKFGNFVDQFGNIISSGTNYGYNAMDFETTPEEEAAFIGFTSTFYN